MLKNNNYTTSTINHIDSQYVLNKKKKKENKQSLTMSTIYIFGNIVSLTMMSQSLITFKL